MLMHIQSCTIMGMKTEKAVGVAGDGGASVLCSKYSSQQYDRCAQGY
jgi:hypothetical protein